MSSMASLGAFSWVLFLDVVGQASCSRPFLVVAVSGRPLHEVFEGSSISCFSRHRTFLSLTVGANLLTYRQTQAVTFLRPGMGGWIVTEKLLLFSLTVVSAVFRGCKTASGGSPSSTGFEPGADEAADPSASTPVSYTHLTLPTILLV